MFQNIRRKLLLKLEPTFLGADGRGGPNLLVPAGGARQRNSEASCVAKNDGTGNIRSDDNLYMNGPEIFNFALSTVPDGIQRLLSREGLAVDDVDFFLMHQANAFILEVIRRKLNIPPEKMPIDIADIGNTAGPSLPILFSRIIERGLLQPKMKLVLAGFGVGYAWGMTSVTWLGGEV